MLGRNREGGTSLTCSVAPPWAAHVTSLVKGTPTDSVRAGLRFLALMIWVGCSLPVLQTGSLASGDDPLGRAGVALMFVYWLCLPLAILRRPDSRRLFWLLGALWMVAEAMQLPHRELVQPINRWSPGHLALPWVMWATMVMPRRGYRLVAWGVMGMATLVDMGWTMLDGIPVTGRRLLVSVWIITPCIMAMQFGDTLRRVAERLEVELAQGEKARLLAQAHQAELDGRAEAARLLHDHLLHALHAIARIGGAITPAMVRGECADTVEALSQPRVREATVSLDDLIEVEPLLTQNGARVAGSTGHVPTDVGQAMITAFREALDSVQRHAHATEVRVDLGQEGGRHIVTISDDGAGFDPDRVSERRLGVRESIVGRMSDVGGTATVDSHPGRGTRVRLVWPRRDEESGHQAWSTQTDALLRRNLLQTAWPGMAATLAAAILMQDGPGSQWMLPIGLLQVAVGAFHSWRIHQRPIRWMDAVILLAVSLGTWVATLAAAPDAPRDIYDLWPVWGCTSLLHLVVLQLPVRTGLATLVTWTLLMIGGTVVRCPSLGWATMNPLVSASIGEGVLTLATLAIAKVLVARQLDERQRADRARLTLARQRQSWQVQDYWSDLATGEALPMIEGIADGSVDPTDEQVVTRARQLELTLRDQLVLGSSQTVLIDAIAAVRQAGWMANTPFTHGDTEDELHALTRCLQHLGRPRSPGQVVNLSVSPTGAALVVLHASELQIERWQELSRFVGFTVDADEDFVRLLAQRTPHELRPTGAPAPLR